MQKWDAGDVWMSNQGALLRASPELAVAVAGAQIGRTVLRDVDGLWTFRRHRHIRPLLLTPEAITVALDTLEEDSPSTVVVEGIGGGGLLAAALQRWPEARVVGWQRDLDVLRVALERLDFSAELLSGRLELTSGVDCLSLPKGEGVHRIVHPDFAAEEVASGDGPWVVVLDGGLFVQDLIDVLPEMGFRVFRMRSDAGPVDWFVSNLQRLGAVAVFGINHAVGLAELCTAVGVTLIEWEIDPALDGMQTASGGTDRAHLFTWRRANVAEWTRRGFSNVAYLPLASNVERRRPLSSVDQERYGAPVAFVGNSLAERLPGLRASLQGVIECWARERNHADPARFAAGLIPQLIEQGRDALPEHAAPLLLEKACPGLLQTARGLGLKWVPEQVLGEIVGAFWRLQTVASLARFGVEVWGDTGWKALEPHGVRYRGFAGHHSDLDSIYSAVDVHVDIGRVYQADIVTMRVFDVLASGGFLLAAWSEGLDELFELGEELVVWRTVPELVAKVDHYLKHPEERRAIATRGRDRVLRDHSVRGRLRHMLAQSGMAGAAAVPAGD